MQHIREVFFFFATDPGDYSFEAATNGLINKSYKVSDEQGRGKYFLQQIAADIFHDVNGLMKNISMTIKHLHETGTVEHLKLVQLKDSDEYLYADGSEYWRLYRFIDGKTYKRATRPAPAREAGRAYGNFLKAISSLDSGNFVDTIPRFHDIFLRYEQFYLARKKANKIRLIQATEQIGFVEEHVDLMRDYYRSMTRVSPKRITHNDTKLSNLIFDEQDFARVVVDYDTLMPGYLALDYGDAVRTICSSTEEDSRELDRTFYKVELIQLFTSEFVRNLGDVLSKDELRQLPMAISYMPFIVGLRMLTDYLKNDIYFATDYAEHNLDRAKNQFTVFMSGLNLQQQMNNIVKDLN